MKKVLDKRGNPEYNIHVAERYGKAAQSFGSIAQLGEHLPYKQGVTGSSPVVPTNFWPGSSVG